MSPEELQQHLLLKTRARTIPDKKKQNDRRACRNSRQALRGIRVSSAAGQGRQNGSYPKVSAMRNPSITAMNAQRQTRAMRPLRVTRAP